jgi:phage baseplate assembly protein gpV
MLLSTLAYAQSQPSVTEQAAAVSPDETQEVLTPCTTRSGDCGVPKADQKRAQQAFERGVKLAEQHHLQAALDEFASAATLVPRNVDYATAREITRQSLVRTYLQNGSELLDAGNRVGAMGLFRAALAADPSSTAAAQRLRDAAGLALTQKAPLVQRLSEVQDIAINPSPVQATFHFSGDTRALMDEIARVFGISATVDDSVRSINVRFNVEDVDFFKAMDLAGQITKTFYVPLTDKQVLIEPDEQASRTQFERMAVQHFYLTDASTPQEVNEIINVLRAVFEIRFISIDTHELGIAVRAPRRLLDAAAEFIASLADTRPQVMLDVRVFQISHSLARTLGVELPLQFQIFNLSPAALAAALGTSGGNLQNLINQLISGGGINQANSTAISALLAQLQNQQTGLLSQPLATFGGGITRFGVGIPPATANFQLNTSDVRSIDHLTLRTMQNNAATLFIGERYPIMNASFAPIFNTAAISQVIGNGSFIAPFPSFTYEDLGISMKATPTIHGDRAVTLKLEMAIKALGGQSFNGVPVLTNREYQGMITVRNGESAVLVGYLSQQDQRSLNGMPFLTGVPGVSYGVSNENRQASEDELLITVTPNVISYPNVENTLQVIAR